MTSSSKCPSGHHSHASTCHGLQWTQASLKWTCKSSFWLAWTWKRLMMVMWHQCQKVGGPWWLIWHQWQFLQGLFDDPEPSSLMQFLALWWSLWGHDTLFWFLKKVFQKVGNFIGGFSKKHTFLKNFLKKCLRKVSNNNNKAVKRSQTRADGWTSLKCRRATWTACAMRVDRFFCRLFCRIPV